MKIKELLENLTFKGYPCTSDCSGHQAGWEYAVHWGLEPDECPYGNSNSFWEGCKSRGEEEQEIEENIEARHEPTKTGGVEIHAYKDGQEVGWVRFQKLRTGQYKASMVHVPEKYRRQGVGTAMYSYAKQELGLDIVPSDTQTDLGKAFWKKQDVSENFADGRVKGKSRPGRVKRAGASCKGSVTSLRQKAKNSGGERAKMYHWCANMKSGRKK